LAPTEAPCHHHTVAKALIGTTLLIAVAALAVAIAAFREARAPNERPTLAEVTAAGVREFTEAGNRMTPAQVVQLFGKPDQVYRNNPRALLALHRALYNRDVLGAKTSASLDRAQHPTRGVPGLGRGAVVPGCVCSPIDMPPPLQETLPTTGSGDSLGPPRQRHP
jgi:hypothetical protein